MQDYIIMDQNNVFMSPMMNYLLKNLNVIMKTVDPYIHPSLQTEYSIKSLSNIFTTHLTGRRLNIYH